MGLAAAGGAVEQQPLVVQRVFRRDFLCRGERRLLSGAGLETGEGTARIQARNPAVGFPLRLPRLGLAGAGARRARAGARDVL